MNRIYTLLFSLSIILINPIGAMRGEIWTQPKVFAISLICILNFLILWEHRENLNLPQSWKISRLLWEIFLGIGLISTLASPFPWRSLFGQEQMGDGLLYWLIIAIFTLSNNLLLRLHPELARSQLQGLVIGGVILAISIFPQVINWHIDYTITSGQLIQSNILASTIFQNQQPIGLYWLGGHSVSLESPIVLKKLHLNHTVIICLLFLLGNTQSQPESQWTPQMSAEFQQRSQKAITQLAGKHYGSTAFENEKRSYPRAMIDILAGNREKAIAFLQSEDADADRNAHTLGIDFYSGFTLKAQVRKYFYFGKYLDPSYRWRMKEAMGILTQKDPLIPFHLKIDTDSCRGGRGSRGSRGSKKNEWYHTHLSPTSQILGTVNR